MEECPQLSERPGSTGPACKRYALEQGSGERAEEVQERWQRLLQVQRDSNVRLLFAGESLYSCIIL